MTSMMAVSSDRTCHDSLLEATVPIIICSTVCNKMVTSVSIGTFE